MTKHIKLILLAMFFSGLIIFLYPFVSQYFNKFVESKAISNYNQEINLINEKDYEEIFKNANNYNQELFKLEFPLSEYKKLSGYKDNLNVLKNGMMGYIIIDKIKVELPIYHGTSKSVLNTSVGHMEGSSLPIGGDNNHSILSAHRGLPTSTLFTNLNKLEIGDTFDIKVLNKTLTYQIDSINVVKPSDISNLKIEDGKDYITLITCTPYGINTHRLLVRGVRIENIENKEIIITSDAYQIDKLLVSVLIIIPVVLVLVIIITLKPSKKIKVEEI